MTGKASFNDDEYHNGRSQESELDDLGAELGENSQRNSMLLFEVHRSRD